jgi:hypothetical protein
MRFKRDWMWLFVMAAIVLLTGANGQSCCKPPVTGIPRTGSGNDGSAKWAINLATPALQACGPDVEIRMLIGVRVAPNGRLFTNAGAWSVVGWSPSRQEDCQVNVKFDGTTDTTTRANAAPGPGEQKPFPASFADSTDIFAAAVAQGGTGAESTLTMFNHTAYSGHPGQAAWAVNFSNNNYWFDANGTFLGN